MYTLGFFGEYSPEPHASWELDVSLPSGFFDIIAKRIKRKLNSNYQLILTFPLKKKLSEIPYDMVAMLREQDFIITLQKK